MRGIRNRTLMFVLLVLSSATLLAQGHCNQARFGHDPVFSASEVVTQRNVSFGTVEDAFGAPYKLFMDVTYPDTLYDTLSQIPVIFMTHGGAWLIGDKSSVTNQFSTELAMRGYLIVSINYRLGWRTRGAAEDCKGDDFSFLLAMYRSFQDMDAAMRYVASTEFNTKYRQVDTNNVFVGGSSAGAVISLSAAFIDQSEINASIPELADSLGLIDTAGNNHTGSLPIKAVTTLSGDMLDTNFISAGDAIPVLAFHGVKDSVVPYGGNPVMYCDTPKLFPVLYSGGAVTKRLANLNTCYQMNRDDLGGHAGKMTLYTNDYIIERMTCFYKSLMCDECQSIELSDSIKPDENCYMTAANESLPVEMVSFEAKAADNGESVELNWVTALEKGVLKYEVQRSADGQAYTSIGTIEATGDTRHMKNYRYTDSDPMNGITYYRLKILFIDEPSEYSQIQAVELYISQAINIYPNPFADRIVIENKEGNIPGNLPEVYTQNGQSIQYEYSKSTGIIEINTQSWVPGVYYLRTISQEGKVTKLIKY